MQGASAAVALSAAEGVPIMMDEVEAMLCKSKPGRVLQKFDRFIKGQSIFVKNIKGVPWVLRYGKRQWEHICTKFNTVSDHPAKCFLSACSLCFSLILPIQVQYKPQRNHGASSIFMLLFVYWWFHCVWSIALRAQP